MSRAGNVWDDSTMESFFPSLKTERTARKVYRTRDKARADIFDEARTRAGLSVSFLKQLLAHIDGTARAQAHARTKTLTDLQRVMALWSGFCNLTETGQILVIRPEQVKALIQLATHGTSVHHGTSYFPATSPRRRCPDPA